MQYVLKAAPTISKRLGLVMRGLVNGYKKNVFCPNFRRFNGNGIINGQKGNIDSADDAV
jgi:hypothetical protein